MTKQEYKEYALTIFDLTIEKNLSPEMLIARCMEACEELVTYEHWGTKTGALSDEDVNEVTMDYMKDYYDNTTI